MNLEIPSIPVEHTYTGTCAAGMPALSKNMALYFFIVNIFFPGCGTFWSSCCDTKGCNWTAFLLSLGQGFTASFLVGWIWSIYWGFKMYIHNIHNDPKLQAAAGAMLS